MRGKLLFEEDDYTSRWKVKGGLQSLEEGCSFKRMIIFSGRRL